MRKSFILLVLLVSLSPAFAKGEIDLGAGYNFALGTTPALPNSKTFICNNFDFCLGCSFTIKNDFGVFTRLTFFGPIPEYTGAAFTLGANYVHSLDQNAFMSLELGYASSILMMPVQNQASESGGGRGVALNMNYSYIIEDWIALRFALNNNFTLRNKNFEYTYPSTFAGMYYKKPQAYTKTIFFTWQCNPCIEVVLLIGGH